jgi:hypothetical protein
VFELGCLSAQACFGHGHLFIALTRRKNHQTIEVYISDTQCQAEAAVV